MVVSEHQGHRERMKEKLMEIGLDKFQEHEMIEVLLFFGIPYKDTNILAHKLIKKFGSFAGVLDASIEELVSESGMTKNAALLINTLPQFFREYKKSRINRKKPIMHIDDILPLLDANFHLRDMEVLNVICLNAAQRIVAVVETGVAEVSSVLLSPRAILDIAMRYKAVNIIIAHNHPSGTIQPSDTDIALTIELKHMLKSIDVELVDHIIITDDDAYSFFLNSEIKAITGCKIKPYIMSEKEQTNIPHRRVVNIIKKDDGSFERFL